MLLSPLIVYTGKPIVQPQSGVPIRCRDAGILPFLSLQMADRLPPRLLSLGVRTSEKKQPA